METLHTVEITIDGRTILKEEIPEQVLTDILYQAVESVRQTLEQIKRLG